MKKTVSRKTNQISKKSSNKHKRGAKFLVGEESKTDSSQLLISRYFKTFNFKNNQESNHENLFKTNQESNHENPRGVPVPNKT